MDLKQILNSHQLWLSSNTQEGERANLRGANLQEADLWRADLRGANLQEADLWGVIGNRCEIKSMQIETWNIVYTKTHLHIGCEQHYIGVCHKESFLGIDPGLSPRTIEKWQKIGLGNFLY